jgi:PEP-CTERM motif
MFIIHSKEPHMIKKLFASTALALVAASPAFALTNPGFEAGNTSGWFPTIPNGGLQVVGYGTPGAMVNVVDDVYITDPITGNPVPTTILSRAVDAVPTSLLAGTGGVGNYFGLIETCAANVAAVNCPSAMTATFNLGGPVSAYGDYFLARLFTAEYLPNYNDSVTISYFGAGSATALATDVVSVQSIGTGQPDSGWFAFGVPVGTQSIYVQVDNVALVPFGGNPNDKLYNRPIVAIDYAAAVTPVPEADASAMMLAGLGVLGLVARRRKAKSVA